MWGMKAERLLFTARESEQVSGVKIVECSMCVWDVTDWCATTDEPGLCSMYDLVRQHAKFHKRAPRVVWAVRP